MSEPAFYELSSLSFGLQAGVENSESILVVQTLKGVDTLLTSTVKLGGDDRPRSVRKAAGWRAQPPRTWARIS
jgi:lipid-binding SYLF domain-containing protein